MNSVVSTQRQVLDLSLYDLECSELLALDWKKEINQLELKLRLAAEGWGWKEARIKFFGAIGLGSLMTDRCVEYITSVTFLGVTEVVETLVSEGHKVEGRDPSDTTWMKSFIFQIDDLRVERLETNVFRFHLLTEDLELAFNFVDFIMREKCIEFGAPREASIE